MLEITTSRFAMLGRFVRIESIFILGDNEQELGETPSIYMLSDDVNNLNPIVTLVNGVVNGDNIGNGGTGGVNSNELNLNLNTKYLSQQSIGCESYLKALNLTIRCESAEL